MELTDKLLNELQKRLKIGNRRGVHLNAIPANSRYKFDLTRLSHIDKNLPNSFIERLLSEQPLKFRISWKGNVPDLNTLFEDDQTQLVRITKSFENLINQTEAIESEKGINTFGFGFPILVRRDQSDNKLTVAPILIWSLRIKRTKEFNTWEINRNEDDPIYLNEVLINHLQSDSNLEIKQIPSEMLDDGLISKDELLEICVKLIKEINTYVPSNIKEDYSLKLGKIVSIGEKKHYDELPINSTNAVIDFGGLFSIFEVQKQNIINDYSNLMNLEDLIFDLRDLENHTFQPISSVETDPSQQGILHSLQTKRNILIQGPPGTGKSQTLSAILINALENQRKTIVVCEKRTALEVLHNALIEKNLNYQCVLIRDIVKDRKTVVDSVRDRVDNSSYRSYTYTYSKDSLDNLVNKAKTLIESINGKHKKLGEKLLGEKSWSAIVGILLAELNGFGEDHTIKINKSQFKFNSQELTDFMELVGRAQILFKDFQSINFIPFINTSKFQGENPYQLEKVISDKFKKYENDYTRIKDLIHNKNWWQKIWFPKLLKAVTNLKVEINSDNLSNVTINSRKYTQVLIEIDSLIAESKKYFKDTERFLIDFKWFQFYNSLTSENKLIINELKGKKDWRKAFLVNYLNSLLLNSANIDLPTNDFDHIELNGTLGGLEKEQLKFIREFWFSRQIQTSRKFELRNTNLSVENLYNKRSSNRFKRLSLRQIVQFDPELFTTFFPIILTSPDVASNLFQGMNGYFDIVMFDEASQLRLEDNLPAILKGKQKIIAGDEHQMPPSNYFSKVFDGTIEDEDDIEDEDEIFVDKDNILLSCESLLDFGTELNFEKRHLDFHYRSRHPFLIDFSNYAFYNQRLKPLPNTFDYTPIKYIQVNGTFSDHINDAEAEMVLSILDNNLNRLPNGKYPTVGIATFNIAQRNHIKSKILERQKFSKFEAFNTKIQELEENGMFIKNLENIQGDERDVIILSTTYGPGKDGKFAQRFGPINHSKGYKLLNVIITRAKYKVYVCSSVPETAFMNYKESLITEGSNNKRAVFYAYLAYSKAISEGNDDSRIGILTALSENSTINSTFNPRSLGELESPFEEEVYQRLIDEVDESKLIPQMKVSEFRIDIVYDPKLAGVPKIAIECDGAKYHSSREAYLHDIHRQKILESHGFVFHRIWSTNWWRNPQRETKRLIEFIRSVESRNDHNLIDRSKTSFAFTDNVGMVESYVAETNFLDVDKEISIIKSIEKNGKSQLKLIIDQIKLGSKVTVKYLNNGNDIRVLIVEFAGKNEFSDGFQKISLKSPLASSILGHCTGDIVKIGDLDNFVEIIEVKN
ncbi:AAA domain-containing protein [Aquiflexum sp. LQ15W]|uniref:AAA domain-containing protein n=1 Tax=Cognataquiflexum nitidum TaxID=2922272 RepID=UPI001F12E0CC|nr:AAA domain-containing protein [Cognataquiflexum nitidum]MCH6199020.1 AAA domain-containing protein [Cognataquiflexum nitidum]